MHRFTTERRTPLHATKIPNLIKEFMFKNRTYFSLIRRCYLIISLLKNPRQTLKNSLYMKLDKVVCKEPINCGSISRLDIAYCVAYIKLHV